MTPRQLFSAGLGLYCFTLLAGAPAVLLDTALGRASDGQLRLVQAEGTVWSGSGQLELRTTRGLHRLSLPTRWQLHPRALLTGRLAFKITLAAQPEPFEMSLRVARFELRQLTLQLPVSRLASSDPGLSALGLDGEIGIAIARLSISRDGIDGTGLLHWRKASSQLSPVSPLGDYQLRFDGDGHAMRLYLQTLRGPLQLDGIGRWMPGETPEMSATARIPTASRSQFAPLLRLVARERADGSFAFEHAPLSAQIDGAPR